MQHLSAEGFPEQKPGTSENSPGKPSGSPECSSEKPPASAERFPEKPPVSVRVNRPKPPSAAQIAANRVNGKKSKGPEDTSQSRFNATTHGLLAAGITKLDDAEGYFDTLRDLEREKKPLGVVEKYFVKDIALNMTRQRRAVRLEAEYLRATLHPTIRKDLSEIAEQFSGTLVDAGLPATECESVQPLVSIFQRYESIFSGRIVRSLHELERVQRMRKGEHLPAPAAVDVTIHVDPSKVEEPSEKVTLDGSLSTHPDKQEEVDSGTAAEEDEAARPPEEN